MEEATRESSNWICADEVLLRDAFLFSKQDRTLSVMSFINSEAVWRESRCGHKRD